MLAPPIASSGPPTTNLVSRWEADSLVALAEGDPIGTWADQSGNGHDATQSNASLKPWLRTNDFGSKPSVQFDGSNDILSIAGTISLPAFTVFIVLNAKHWISGSDFTVQDYNLTNMLWWHSGIHGFALNGTGGGNQDPHLTTYNTSGTETNSKRMNSGFLGGKGIFVWTYDGSSIGGRYNGVAKSPSNNDGGFGTSNPDNIGWSYLYTGSRYAAILIYGVALDSTNISAVESYLNTKYLVF